jgi:hypothetical protein
MLSLPGPGAVAGGGEVGATRAEPATAQRKVSAAWVPVVRAARAAAGASRDLAAADVAVGGSHVAEPIPTSPPNPEPAVNDVVDRVRYAAVPDAREGLAPVRFS